MTHIEREVETLIRQDPDLQVYLVCVKDEPDRALTWARFRRGTGEYFTLDAIICSMSRTGNCHDNAVMESFFSTGTSEVGEYFDSCGEAKMEICDFIEVFYNQRRRHSTLGQSSPAAFERRAAAMDAAVPVDAKNASTRDLENRQERGFPQRPPPSLFMEKHERRDALTT